MFENTLPSLEFFKNIRDDIDPTTKKLTSVKTVNLCKLNSQLITLPINKLKKKFALGFIKQTILYSYILKIQ